MILAFGFTILLALDIYCCVMGYTATWLLVFLPTVAIFLTCWYDVITKYVKFERITVEGAEKKLISMLRQMSDTEIEDLRADYKNIPGALEYLDQLIERSKEPEEEQDTNNKE